MYEYDVHGVKVRTGIMFGIPEYFRKTTRGTTDLFISSKDSVDVQGAEAFFPPYIFFKKNSLLHKYGFAIPTRLSMTDLEGKARIEYTRLYGMLLDVKDIARCVLNFKLMQAGLIKTHASCVETPNGDGVMFAGWDHSGKSTLARNMTTIGSKFLSDDTTIISGTRALCYPKPIKAFRGLGKVSRRLNTIPLVNRALGVNEEIDPHDVKVDTKVRFLFMARYGDKRVERIDRGDAARTIELLSTYVTELLDRRHLILEYCHYNKFDLPGLIAKRRDVIDKFLKNVQCYELVARNVSDSEELVRKTIGI